MTNSSYPSGLALRSVAAAMVLLLGSSLQVQAQVLRRPSPFGADQAARAPAAASQRQADFIVAVVNSEPITNHEVQARLERAERQLAGQAGVPPRSQLAREILERLIVERAQLQVARTLGVRADDAAVDQAVASVARQNDMSADELRRRMTADGLSFAQFREDLRGELTLLRLREREIEPRVKVTEQDIDQFLREQQAGSGAVAQEVNIAQILVAVPENASPAQVTALQAKAQQALERARTGADFAALATELSDAPDRTSGGQLGLRSADRYPPLFIEVTRNVAVGGLAGPVRSGAGFHVLKVLERKQGGLPTAVTQTRARHILLRPNAQLSEQAAVARLAEYKRRIAAGQADFAALAREHSQDGSAKDGGDLGWAGPGMFVPEFEQVMNGLPPGKVSDPLVSRFGVHLIEVVERKQTQLSQREQRDIVRNMLREKKLGEEYSLWVQELRGRAYVEYREPPQ